jgi:hypothetical protein
MKKTIMQETEKYRLNCTVSEGVYDAIEIASQRLKCSKGEVIRTAIYFYLHQLGLIKEQITKRKLEEDAK